jgi:hypothetical protein
VSGRMRENLVIAVAMLALFGALLLAASTELATTTTCQEDENWVSTHYSNPQGEEDSNGVTRWCQPADAEEWVPTR